MSGVVHKMTIAPRVVLCGYQPKERGWAGKTDDFWDRVTCKKCLAKKS